MTDDSAAFEMNNWETIDLDGVEEQSFDALPGGNYEVTITNCTPQRSKAGHPMLVLELTVIDGEYTNRKLFAYLSLSPKALGMTKGHLKNISPELAEGQLNPGTMPERIIDKRVVVKVKIEDWNGEPSNKVVSYRPSQIEDAPFE